MTMIASTLIDNPITAATTLPDAKPNTAGSMATSEASITTNPTLKLAPPSGTRS